MLLWRERNSRDDKVQMSIFQDLTAGGKDRFVQVLGNRNDAFELMH